MVKKTILLVSHGNQIKFFLKKFFDRAYEKKVNHGAVLKIIVRKNWTSVQMIYNGKNCTDEFYKKKTFPKKFRVPTETITDATIEKKDTIIIYLLRHGISEHNVSPKISKKDTSLVMDGKRDIVASRKYIPKKIFRLFSSPLLRTRQTIEFLLPKTYQPKEIFVIPNATEIEQTYKKYKPNIPYEKNRDKPKSYHIIWEKYPEHSNFIDLMVKNIY